LIPDRRLLAEARTGLWRVRHQGQIFVSEQDVQRIESGPGLLFTALLPDIDHFSGWGGSGVHPLWLDPAMRTANFSSGLLFYIGQQLGTQVSAESLLAYIAAVVAHPEFTKRFCSELEIPGIRVPITSNPSLWSQAIKLGSELIWLHTFGSHYVDPVVGRFAGERGIIDRYGIRCASAVRKLPSRLPDQLDYDEDSETLFVGNGAFTPVSSSVVRYNVAGRRVLWRWLNDRTREPRFKKITYSDLDNLTVEEWDRGLNDELMTILSILTGCTAIEAQQRQLLDDICSEATITVNKLKGAGVNLGSIDRSRLDEINGSSDSQEHCYAVEEYLRILGWADLPYRQSRLRGTRRRAPG
jgi:hypothetical protein